MSFSTCQSELQLKRSEFVAFGSTRRAKGKVDQDQTLANLIGADTNIVCIVGKCWDYHVTEALQTSLEEGIAMVSDSVEYLVNHGKRVFLTLSISSMGTKQSRIFFACTRSGFNCWSRTPNLMRHQRRISTPRCLHAVASVAGHLDTGIGVHLHNDTGCGVANALAGVMAGAIQVQGTINGYGERTGNCDLVSIIANLSLKMGIETIPSQNLDL